MKIAVLGGGFNPPHLGHLLLCEQILSFTDIERIWLMPYFAHPWSKVSLEPKHRLAMCKKMATDKIQVSDLEIKLGKKNYTYETVQLLRQRYPQHFFSWVIGSDLYAEFFKWEGADIISQKMRVLVFPRAGWPISSLPPNFYTINNNLLARSDISSEKIREMVQRNLSIKGLVTGEVEEYIKKHHLYRDY